jgi:aryl-alcohol dehydrogenase-like predicted oxidoreductase
LQKRKLGSSELMVTPWALGANVFGWTADEATSFALLDGYVAAGGNFIDTADVYSTWVPGHQGGESEAIIGKWMKARGNRKQLIIATKVGMEMGPGRKGLAPAYIRQSVDASLQRLQTDYIDLYQSHEDDPKTPFEETLSTYADLIRAGKVRAIGASNYGAERLEEALKTSKAKGLPAYQSLQPQYNLYDREGYEEKLEPLCVSSGLGVLSYFSLARGFLTGKYRSEADLSQEPARRRRQALSERARHAHPRCARSSGRQKRIHAGPRWRSGWAMARPSITSRSRAPAIRRAVGSDRGDAVAARRGRDRSTESCERIKPNTSPRRNCECIQRPIVSPPAWTSHP